MIDETRRSIGNSEGNLFRDILFLALLSFVLITLILLIHFNPKAEESDLTPPGNIIVEIFWPDELNTDVDLWVMAPGDIPVGYSNSNGKIFNLLRDDLGHLNDRSPVNQEIAYSRGIIAGEYVVNIHLYNNRSGKIPIPVTCIISRRIDDNSHAEQILETHAVLKFLGQELTLLRFRLTEKGVIVDGSIHDRPFPLRSGR